MISHCFTNRSRPLHYYSDFAVLSLLAWLIGCAPARPFIDRDFVLNEPKEASVGSRMLLIEAGWMNAAIDTDQKNRGILQELTYGGKSATTIKLLYREYVRENRVVLNRPAYTQELQYDLNESNTITFRELRIQILRADNNSIAFKVIASGDPNLIN
jgi:hypothetical protein